MNLTCKTCGRGAGGFCCGCDEPICLSCVMTVKVTTGVNGIEEYRHRCATCAAAIVLTEPVEETWPTTILRNA